MITEVSSPPDVVPVLNEVEYLLETDNRITTPGSPYVKQITILLLPSDGETLVFDLMDTVYTLTFKNSPLALYDVQIEGTISDQIDTIIAACEKLFLVYTNYQLVNNTPTLELTANVNASTGYGIDISASTASTGAFDIAGVDEEQREGFRIQVDVWKYTQTIGSVDYYDKVNGERYEPNNSEQLIFDSSQLLVSILDYDLPAYNQTAPSLCSKVFKKFKIAFGEYYSDKVQNYIHSSQKGALLAALPEADIPGNTFYADHFTTGLNQKFLTACPRGHTKTNKTAQHYLYFYQRTDFVTAYYVLYIEYTDDTTSVEDQVFILGQPGDIIILPAGYSQLDIDTLKTPGKTVKSWAIQVGANGADYTEYAAYTEKYYYLLDNKPFQNNRYMLFANTYGGLETLWCNGDVEFSNSTDSETYNIHKGGDTPNIIKATQKTTFGLRQSLRKISTGFISREYLEYITAQLLFTTAAYEIVNGQYRAILIDKSSIKETHTTADGKFQLTFGYKYAQEEKA